MIIASTWICFTKRMAIFQESTFASGGSEPFYKRVPTPPKIFYKVLKAEGVNAYSPHNYAG